MFRLIVCLATFSLFLLAPDLSAGEFAPEPSLIYATVQFPDGETHTGYLRWVKEEATWDDLFHCGYRESPWTEFIDAEAFKKDKRDHFYQSHGLIKRVVYALRQDDLDIPGWRMFLIRIGDIQRFEIHAGKDDYIIVADGSKHRIGGYANDDGSDLWLYEKNQEPLRISWNDLVSIDFHPTPDDHPPYATRLFGTVETNEGSFTGPIMWDKSECLSIDQLDGKNDQGKISLAMGDIHSIRKQDNQSVFVEMKDGRAFEMFGSNDVDHGNRGIWVLTPDFGWVDISWKVFQKATFAPKPGCGSPHSDFGHNQPLRGKIELEDGTTRQGRLVYDLDEGFSWDIFNGTQNQISYDIPFTMITRIVRLDNETSRVHLRSGHSLELSQNQDTGVKHGGVLVFNEDESAADYFPWGQIAAVEFSFRP